MTDVHPEFEAAFLAFSAARRAKGIATYGRPLQTDDGRDNWQDMAEELFDFSIYQRKEIMKLQALVARLRAANSVSVTR